MFAASFLIVGTLMPLFVEIVTPASTMLVVHNIEIEYREGNVAVMHWDRWVRNDMRVSTYLDLEVMKVGYPQAWDICYTSVFYQSGRHVFNLPVPTFPQYLEPGVYRVIGLSVFHTSMGVRKTVSFTGEPFTVD